MSWLRHGDTHLLTVGLFTFTLLDRFSAIHRSNSEDWVLEIRNTKVSDQGKIKCIYTLRKICFAHNQWYCKWILILSIIVKDRRISKKKFQRRTILTSILALFVLELIIVSIWYMRINLPLATKFLYYLQ